MTDKISDLMNLMNKNWIYEVIITTKNSDGTIRAAPMGIFTPDSERIILEIYKTSKTAGNLIRSREFIINLVSDVELFRNAVMLKELKFRDLHLNNCSWLEMNVEKVVEEGEKIKIYSKITGYEILSDDYELINRAKYLAFESIIKFTKPDLSKARDEIYENLRVIKRVAPGSKYEKIVGGILREIKNNDDFTSFKHLFV